MATIERRKPREPFTLRLWHTFGGGVLTLATAIYGIGFLYDSGPTTGTRVSMYITTILFGVIGLITAICSLGALENRKGMRSPWAK